MLEHANVIWLIRTFFPRTQRHCTHILCWNMQRSFDWSKHPSWEIRGTALTSYVGTCKNYLTDQNILSEKSETLHSLSMLEHAKVIWLIKTSSHKIRGIALTHYIGTCKGYWIYQQILSKKSETLHSLPTLEYAEVIWLVRSAIDIYIKNTYWLDIQLYINLSWENYDKCVLTNFL